MAELQIKTESLPQRCEVCHKSDCFKPQSGYCSRCNYSLDEASGFLKNKIAKINSAKYLSILTLSKITSYLLFNLFFHLYFFPIKNFIREVSGNPLPILAICELIFLAFGLFGLNNVINKLRNSYNKKE